LKKIAFRILLENKKVRKTFFTLKKIGTIEKNFKCPFLNQGYVPYRIKNVFLKAYFTNFFFVNWCYFISFSISICLPIITRFILNLERWINVHWLDSLLFLIDILIIINNYCFAKSSYFVANYYFGYISNYFQFPSF